MKTERHEVSTSDFAAEIFKLTEGSESINALIYGDSNVGKTVLSSTLPENTFWLVCEPGYKSAARFRARHNQPPHKGGRRITDTATALAAVDWLHERRRCDRLDWLVLDGASTMQDRFRLGYAQEAFDIDSSKRQHRNLPDRPDYFNTQNFLKLTLIPLLIDMPCNLLVTAHAYRTDQTEDGELLVFPGFQGKVSETANAISGLMDITGYMQKRRVRQGDKTVIRRRLWFDQPEPQGKREDPVRYVVGDKFGVLPEYMDSPSMPKILKYINGEQEESE